MDRLGATFFTALLCVTVALSGCGAGGGPVAGIDRGGLRGVSGPVTGFGSVIVNGVHYETSSAAISVNGLPATEADLEVGYVVVIQADLPADGSSPQAITIDFSHDIVGPLSAVSVADSRSTVLGQSVIVDEATAYGSGITPASIDGLAMLPMDTIVRVSGFAGADDSILATRIDLAVAGSGLEVTGLVMNLDTAVQTFEMGGLVVRYDSANLEGFPGGQPQGGDRVKAEGSLDAGGMLVADELEFKEIGLELEDGDEFEIEGLITQFTASTAFSVSGIAVSTDASTEYENGDATMIGLNVRVEVEGRLDSNGVLQADEVEFKLDGPLRIEATVDSVDPLVLLGITVQTGNQTIFEDKSPAELRPFSLADINPADPLRVVGAESPSMPGVVVATGIIRTEPLEELKLRGIAENLAAPEFSILGVLVITDDSTDIEADFFATAQGHLVEAQGNMTGGSFVAEKVEIKD